MAEKTPFTFRMKNLPKAEYQLLKDVKAHFNLDDDSETVLIALRTLYEVLHYGNGQGYQWVMNVIQAWKSVPHEQRTYELPAKK